MSATCSPLGATEAGTDGKTIEVAGNKIRGENNRQKGGMGAVLFTPCVVPGELLILESNLSFFVG